MEEEYAKFGDEKISKVYGDNELFVIDFGGYKGDVVYVENGVEYQKPFEEFSDYVKSKYSTPISANSQTYQIYTNNPTTAAIRHYDKVNSQEGTPAESLIEGYAYYNNERIPQHYKKDGNELFVIDFGGYKRDVVYVENGVEYQKPFKDFQHVQEKYYSPTMATIRQFDKTNSQEGTQVSENRVCDAAEIAKSKGEKLASQISQPVVEDTKNEENLDDNAADLPNDYVELPTPTPFDNEMIYNKDKFKEAINYVDKVATALGASGDSTKTVTSLEGVSLPIGMPVTVSDQIKSACDIVNQVVAKIKILPTELKSMQALIEKDEDDFKTDIKLLDDDQFEALKSINDYEKYDLSEMTEYEKNEWIQDNLSKGYTIVLKDGENVLSGTAVLVKGVVTSNAAALTGATEIKKRFSSAAKDAKDFQFKNPERYEIENEFIVPDREQPSIVLYRGIESESEPKRGTSASPKQTPKTKNQQVTENDSNDTKENINTTSVNKEPVNKVGNKNTDAVTSNNNEDSNSYSYSYGKRNDSNSVNVDSLTDSDINSNISTSSELKYGDGLIPEIQLSADPNLVTVGSTKSAISIMPAIGAVTAIAGSALVGKNVHDKDEEKEENKEEESSTDEDLVKKDIEEYYGKI